MEVQHGGAQTRTSSRLLAFSRKVSGISKGWRDVALEYLRRPVLELPLWNLLLVSGLLVGSILLPVEDSKVARDLAGGILSGLLGFLALTFAVVSLVAENGVLTGRRAVQQLTRWSSWYLTLILVALAVAIITISRPRVVLAQVLVGLTVVIATLLPNFVVRLARQASASEVARSEGERLARLLQRRRKAGMPANSRRLKEDLNDLRTSAMRLWERSDVEGYITLVDAYLESIPDQHHRSVDTTFGQGVSAGSLEHLSLLGKWVEMHGVQRSSLLLLAQRIAEFVGRRSSDRDLVFELIELESRILLDTIRHEHLEEFHLEALEIGERLGRELSACGPGKPLSLGKHVADRLAELGAAIQSGLLVADRPASVRALTTLLRTRLTLLGAAVGGGPSRAPADALPTVYAIADLIDSVASAGGRIAGRDIELLSSIWFSRANPVHSSLDPRVVLAKPLGSLIASLGALRDQEAARDLLRATLGTLDAARLDSGSVRHLRAVLVDMKDQARLTSDARLDLICQIGAIDAYGGKPPDMRQSIRWLLAPEFKATPRQPMAESVTRCLEGLLKATELSGRVPRSAGSRLDDMDLLFDGTLLSMNELGHEFRQILLRDLSRITDESWCDTDTAIVIRLTQLRIISGSGEDVRLSSVLGRLLSEAGQATGISPSLGHLIAARCGQLAHDFERFGQLEAASRVLTVASMLLAENRIVDEGRADVRLSAVRLDVFERWAGLLRRSPALDVEPGHLEAARRAARPETLVAPKEIYRYLTALLDVLAWSKASPRGSGLPGARRTITLIDEVDPGELCPAVGALKAAARYVVKKIAPRTAGLRPDELLDWPERIPSMSAAEAESVVFGFQLASRVEDRVGSPLWAAHLRLKSAVGVLEEFADADDDRVSDVVRHAATMVVEAARSLERVPARLSDREMELLVRTVRRLGRGVDVILDQRLSMSYRAAIGEIAGKAEVVLAALEHLRTLGRTTDPLETARAGVINRLWAAAGIGGRLEAADPLAAARISAAFYFHNLSTPRDHGLPHTLQQYVHTPGAVRQGRSDSDTQQGDTSSTDASLSMLDRPRSVRLALVRLFDSIAARVAEIGTVASRVSAESNRVEIRLRLKVEDGMQQAVHSYLKVISVSLLEEEYARYPLDFVFGETPRGSGADLHLSSSLLLRVVSGAGAPPEDGPSVAIDDIREPVQEIIGRLVRRPDSRRLSSDIRFRIEALYEGLDPMPPSARAFLDRLLLVWDPHREGGRELVAGPRHA